MRTKARQQLRHRELEPHRLKTLNSLIRSPLRWIIPVLRQVSSLKEVHSSQLRTISSHETSTNQVIRCRIGRTCSPRKALVMLGSLAHTGAQAASAQPPRPCGPTRGPTAEARSENCRSLAVPAFWAVGRRIGANAGS